MVHPSSPFFPNLAIRMSRGTVSNALHESRYGLAPRARLVGYHQSPHLFFFHVPQEGLHEDLLHDLTRQRAEIDWPVVPRIFFFSLLESGGYVSPFPISGNFTRLAIAFQIWFFTTRYLEQQHFNLAVLGLLPRALSFLIS